MKRKYFFAGLMTAMLATGVVVASEVQVLNWPFFAPSVETVPSNSHGSNGDILYDKTNNLFYGKQNGVWEQMIQGAGAASVKSATIEYVGPNPTDFMISTVGGSWISATRVSSGVYIANLVGFSNPPNCSCSVQDGGWGVCYFPGSITSTSTGIGIYRNVNVDTRFSIICQE